MPTTAGLQLTDFGHYLLLLLLAAAIIQSLLLTLQAWEHRRFVRSRMRKPAPESGARRVLLVAPCKGLDLGLEENLRPLLEQDHGNYEVAFVVESEFDPACEVIRRILGRSKVPARLVIAGCSREHGQKVHNLLAATADLSADIGVLAFVDSDARPASTWLRRLTQRLDQGEVGAVTAYRIFIPQQSGMASLLLASLNLAVAGLFGPGGRHLVWGGSWAIRRDVFDKIDLRAAWRGTLSDDLVASRELRRAGLKIEFEPACMVASPMNYDVRGAIEFVRRQFVIARCYVPHWWLGALIMIGLGTAGFWASVVGLALSLIQRRPEATVFGIVTAVLFGLASLRAALRHQALNEYLPSARGALQPLRRLDLWASPLVQLAGLMGLLSSCFTRQVTWRARTYHIRSGGQVNLLKHSSSEVPRSHLPKTSTTSRSHTHSR